MARVRVLDSFRVDVRDQIAWLKRNRDRTWIARLRAGLREARDLLSEFPEAGAGGPPDEHSLRKLVLRRLPFTVWYVHEGSDVWLLRLFHHKQDRSR